jgi:hypothetical protein
MPVRIPRTPGDHWLDGDAVDVLAAIVETHRRGHLVALNRPLRRQGGRVSVQVRLRRQRPRWVRITAITAGILTAVVVLLGSGAAFATWSIKHGAPLFGLTLLIRAAFWMSAAKKVS